jgi:pantothenate kinase type III
MNGSAATHRSKSRLAVVPGTPKNRKALPEVPLPLGLPPMDAYSSTAEAMQAGSYWGLRWEVDGWINAWHTQFPESHVYLTGGDATALVTTRKNGIFAAPKLAFAGLWAWSNEGN